MADGVEGCFGFDVALDEIPAVKQEATEAITAGFRKLGMSEASIEVRTEAMPFTAAIRSSTAFSS
jgi:hypothetical protein